MDAQTKTKNLLWILAITLMFTLVVNAANQRQDNATSRQGQEMTLQSMRQASLFAIKDILKSDVKSDSSMNSDVRSDSSTNLERNTNLQDNTNRKVETIGTVKDVAVSNEGKRITYIVLDSDNKLYPVPWSAFKVQGVTTSTGSQTTSSRENATRENPTINSGREMYEGTQDTASVRDQQTRQKPVFYLSMTKEQLKQAPTISSVSVENLSASNMKERIDSFYSKYTQKQSLQTSSGVGSTMSESRTESMARTSPAQPGQASEKSTLFLVSKIFDLDLEASSDLDMNKIDNLIADSRQGHILYALVSHGGFLSIGENTSAVPWQAITISEKQAKINATREKLEAAKIESNQWYKLEQPQFARQIYQQFGIQPSTVYGFVPGEDDQQRDNQQQQDQQRRQDQQQQDQQRRQQDQQGRQERDY